MTETPKSEQSQCVHYICMHRIWLFVSVKRWLINLLLTGILIVAQNHFIRSYDPMLQKGYLKLTLSNALVSDWQYMYSVWWTCFCTDSRHFYGYQPYFYSRPVVPLFVWTRHNVCAQRGGGMYSHGYEEQAIPNLKSFSHNNSKFGYCVNSTSPIEPETEDYRRSSSAWFP